MKSSNWLNNLIDDIFEFKWNIYVIFILTSILVLPNISRESLEHDEIWTATAAFKMSSLKSMFSEFILNDVHPPLYYIILYYWGKIFGNCDFEIRLLSYAFVITSLIISYLLLKKHFTRRVAVIFVALSSFTPGVLFYAQQLRMYALLYTLANLACVLFFIFITKTRNNQTIEKKFIVVYFFLGVLICYTHFIGYLVVFSLSSITILYSIILKRNFNTRNLFFTSICIAIFGFIWLIIHFYYGGLGSKTQGNFTIYLDLKGAILNFSTLLAPNKYGVLILFLLSIPFCIPLSKLLNAVKFYLVLLYPIVLLISTAYLISLNTPIITYYNLIVIIPLILLFLSFIFNELYNDKKFYIVFYIVGFLMFGTYSSYTYKKQNWRDASHYIENNFNNKTCIIPTKSNRLIMVSYYLGNDFTYSPNGPVVQKDCDLIYVDGHTNEEGIRNALEKNKITIPYKILNFNKVYVVVKK